MITTDQMRTVGLDIATHTGMALIADGEGRGKVISLAKHRGYLRLHMLAEEVARTLDTWKPDLVLIESYAFARNIKSFTVLVECGTVIRQMLYARGIKWVEV